MNDTKDHQLRMSQFYTEKTNVYISNRPLQAMLDILSLWRISNLPPDIPAACQFPTVHHHHITTSRTQQHKP